MGTRRCFSLPAAPAADRVNFVILCIRLDIENQFRQSISLLFSFKYASFKCNNRMRHVSKNCDINENTIKFDRYMYIKERHQDKRGMDGTNKKRERTRFADG